MGCVNGKALLTDDDLDYIAANTAVQRTEVDEYYKNFLEKHPDGKITKKEFKSMIQTCYPSTDTDKLEKHIFRMYDTNGDGYIDFREFMIVLYVMSSGSPEANLRQIFKVFDINNDGTISLKELKRIVKDLYSLFTVKEHEESLDPESASEEVVAQLAFNEMDKNNDGKVTKEEFVKACLSQEKFSTMLALKIIDVFVQD